MQSTDLKVLMPLVDLYLGHLANPTFVKKFLNRIDADPEAVIDILTKVIGNPSYDYDTNLLLEVLHRTPQISGRTATKWKELLSLFARREGALDEDGLEEMMTLLEDKNPHASYAFEEWLRFNKDRQIDDWESSDVLLIDNCMERMVEVFNTTDDDSFGNVMLNLIKTVMDTGPWSMVGVLSEEVMKRLFARCQKVLESSVWIQGHAPASEIFRQLSAEEVLAWCRDGHRNEVIDYVVYHLWEEYLYPTLVAIPSVGGLRTSAHVLENLMDAVMNCSLYEKVVFDFDHLRENLPVMLESLKTPFKQVYVKFIRLLIRDAPVDDVLSLVHHTDVVPTIVEEDDPDLLYALSKLTTGECEVFRSITVRSNADERHLRVPTWRRGVMESIVTAGGHLKAARAVLQPPLHDEAVQLLSNLANVYPKEVMLAIMKIWGKTKPAFDELWSKLEERITP